MDVTLFHFIPIAHAQIGIDFLNLPPGAEIGDVLSRLYVYGVGVVAIAAMIMLVIGGVQYMVAGEKDPGPAKERIRNAIWGLILALTSWLILYTINPDLTRKVKLKPLDINLVPPPKQSVDCGSLSISACTGDCEVRLTATGDKCMSKTISPQDVRWLCSDGFTTRECHGKEFTTSTCGGTVGQLKCPRCVSKDTCPIINP